MSASIEIDYEGNGELHVVVCQPPSGKLYIHATDGPTTFHGVETTQVESDETTYIPASEFVDVDA